MIYSMTGFGRAEKESEKHKIAVEIKSVNHRYLDISAKTPRRFARFESAIRAAASEYVSRGKVDIFVTLEKTGEGEHPLRYNEELARQYVDCASRMLGDFDLEDDFTLTALMRSPEVLTMYEEDGNDEEILAVLTEAVRAAAEEHKASRAGEGATLRADLLAKLDELSGHVGAVKERAPQILEEYKEKLRERTRELLKNAQIDESRVAAEIVLFADKICTDEETVRLESHIAKMKEALTAGGLVGRKLDFIAQEMNREANTILSKSNDLQTSEIGIELKTGIEKIREQIQNIE